jgi:signal transduction histidine kinase
MVTEKPKGNILVVDDTPANLKLLSGMLKENGYKVRPVPSGRLALKAAAKAAPDLILLDIDMPDLDGYETCKCFKQDPQLDAIPVIFISALSETLDKVKAFSVGGVDYITKPFQFEEVEARVETHLQLYRLQRDMKMKNAELHENYKKLQELEEMRDDLVHMIVHDMRSPLMGIATGLEMLLDDIGEQLLDDQQEDLVSAVDAANRLNEMASALLDVSKLESGKMDVQLQNVPIRGVVEEAARMLGATLKPFEFEIRDDGAEELQSYSCDPDLIRRVVYNLLGNAAKHTPAAGTIAVEIAFSEDGLDVSIKDSGPGIPAEYQEHIFDKFGQVKGDGSSKKYSTGVGLTFCKLAIEAHSGEIGVTSEIGKGSDFWFRLPTQAR